MLQFISCYLKPKNRFQDNKFTIETWMLWVTFFVRKIISISSREENYDVFDSQHSGPQNKMRLFVNLTPVSGLTAPNCYWRILEFFIPILESKLCLGLGITSTISVEHLLWLSFSYFLSPFSFPNHLSLPQNFHTHFVH